MAGGPHSSHTDEAAAREGAKLVRGGHYREAIELLQPLRERIENGNFEGSVPVVFKSLGIAYFELARETDARECFELGLNAARRKNDGDMEGACLHELSLMALKTMDAKRALELARDAVVAIVKASLLRSSGPHREPVEALNLVCLSLLSLGALEEAQRVLLMLKEGHEAGNDLPWLSKTLQKLGRVQFLMGHLALGRMYFGQALQVARTCGDDTQVEFCFRDLQECEQKAGTERTDKR